MQPEQHDDPHAPKTAGHSETPQVQWANAAPAQPAAGPQPEPAAAAAPSYLTPPPPGIRAQYAQTPPPMPPQYFYQQPVRNHAPPGAVTSDGVWYEPAGFMPRFGAFLLDFAILLVLGLLLTAVLRMPGTSAADSMQLLTQLSQDFSRSFTVSPSTLAMLEQINERERFRGWMNVAMCACYFVTFYFLTGTTPGKAAFRLKLLTSHGRPPGFMPILVRYAVYFITAKFVYTAWLMLFDSQKRALHDMVTGTNIYKQR